MNTTIAPAPALAPTSGTAAAPRALPWRQLLGSCLALAGFALAWPGGLAGGVGTLAVGAGAWLVFGGARPGGTAGPAQEPAMAGRRGAEVMVAQIVPVWSRQIEVTREAAAEGLAQVLETFTGMTGALDTLAQNLDACTLSAEPGAVDGSVRRESPALDALCAASARAFAERDAAVAELTHCGESLVELQAQAKQTRELSRHARLVAFNASIEANRQGGQAGGGSQAVAAELRMLATRVAETGARIEHTVQDLAARLKRERHRAEVGSTTPEELRLEIDLRAREALTALLGSLGGALQNSAEVEQASRTLRDELEAAFVHFQFGDRVSQMLSVVANDMSNFTQWVEANPRASQSDAAEWLATLESSYTMDEQRSSHHGNVRVDHASGVDFF